MPYSVWCVRGLVKNDLFPRGDSQDGSCSTDFPDRAEAATSHSKQEFSSPDPPLWASGPSAPVQADP